MANAAFTEVTFKKTEIPWLQCGMELLAETGLHQFNIEKLSQRVGKAKTSYYFLFENQTNYFRKLALFWAYEGTQRYFDKIAQITDPKRKFELLIEEIYEDIPSGLTWIHLKTLEAQDEVLKKILDEVQQNRVKVVGSYFHLIGKEPERSEKLAKNFMYAYFGWLVLNWKSGKSDSTKKEELSELFAILELEALDLDFLSK